MLANVFPKFHCNRVKAEKVIAPGITRESPLNYETKANSNATENL